ncbi:MAG: 50S ribosomal protein L37ae [Promethearchaeota archaeon]
MARKKSKSGISGRFGARYGTTLRKRWRKVMEREKGKIKCPRCEYRGAVHRVSTGIWHCRKCDAKFTGGAYYIITQRGLESSRISKRKQRELEVIEE